MIDLPPCSEPNYIPQIFQLLYILVGGGIGFLGAVFVPYLTHKYTRKSEIRKEKLVKLETVVELAQQCSVTAKDAYKENILKESSRAAELFNYPLTQMLTITFIHFPKLNILIDELFKPTVICNEKILAARYLKDTNPSEFDQKAEAMMIDYIVAYGAVVQAVADFSKEAKKEFDVLNKQ